MWDYRAKLIRVIDGDTIELLIDQGLYSRQQESIRLAGCYAPELSTPGGLGAKEFIEKWMSYLDASLSWPLFITTQKTNATEPTEKRTFTRYVAQVFDNASKRWLNEDVNKFLSLHPEWGGGIS